MRSHLLLRWFTVVALLALPVMAQAQEATLSGTVSDSTGGALPGVTVRAVHEATGNNFETVTDERGGYTLAVRVGGYRVTAELAGFAPITRTVTLLVGQAAVVNMELSLSGVQESVTVTGEAPLLDVTTSSLGGNIDARQVEEIPVQGRNWIDLVALAPGATVNAVSESPSETGFATARGGGDFQLNVDGQQVTTMQKGVQNTQPRISKDTIAEFQFVSSRFDATQGRSSGMQVNAITKSGTNTPAGSLSGYFRHDKFNAADPVVGRVLPYQNQQISGTFGGPIRRDKVHFFGNYEYQREPRTLVYTTPYPHFNLDLSSERTDKLGGGRIDVQISPRLRFSARANLWRSSDPSGGGGDVTPSTFFTQDEASTQVLLTGTQVLSNQAVNEIKLGYNSVNWVKSLSLENSRGRFGVNGPLVLLQGLDAGGDLRYPNDQWQDDYSIRNDLTLSFSRGGRHTIKTGGEYLRMNAIDFRCVRCEGELDATLGPIPVPVETLFPDLFDATTWNLAPLSPVTRRFRQVIGTDLKAVIPRHSTGLWLQDDWTVNPRLTLNLGLRYDVELNAFANDAEILPWLPGDRANDFNNLSPRVGFSFTHNDSTVIRGGYGLYFATVATGYYSYYFANTLTVAVNNDGRPNFAADPWNGRPPTFEELQARLCTPTRLTGCDRPEAAKQAAVYSEGFEMPYSHQGSIGFQRQLAPALAFEADYVYQGARKGAGDIPINLTYNPATGANYPFSDISRRPLPHWGFVNATVNGVRSNRHALQTALTKRFSDGWQASGTYTLAYFRDSDPPAMYWNNVTNRIEEVPFPTARDLGGEYGFAIGDQRHRATFNAIRQLPYGFQLSGVYFFGSGQRFHTRYGSDLRGIGALRTIPHRLRPDGTIVPRNDFVGKQIHRVDVRLQRRFDLPGRVAFDGLLEVFNLLNHKNFGSYVGTEPNTTSAVGEISRNYLEPQQSTNVAYAPRTLQLGFRLTF
jgi:hypothetical protein